MAAITEKKRRHGRKPALKIDVLAVNGTSKGLVQGEAEKSGDLFATLVCGFTIVVLLTAFLYSY